MTVGLMGEGENTAFQDAPVWGFKPQRGTIGCVLSEKVSLPEAAPLTFYSIQKVFWGPWPTLSSAPTRIPHF